MIGMLCLAIGLIGQWLLGVFIGSVVLRGRDDVPTKTELAGLGCVLGTGLTAVCLFLYSLCGGSLGLLPSLLLTVAGFVSGGPVVLKWAQGDRNKQGPGLKQKQESALCQACQVVIGVLCGACLLQTLQTPQKLWDERAIFALKARVLYEDGTIRSPALLHPDFVQYHPRYPLLLPLAEEHIYSLLGTVDDRLSKIVFSLLYCGLVLTTIGVLQRHLSGGLAWLSGVMMATIPVLMPYEYGFLCGQADAPVACFHGLSMLYLWDGFRRSADRETVAGSFVMAGVCGGLAAFTKDEGIAYLIIDTATVLVLTFAGLRDWRRTWRLIIGFAVFVLAAVLLLIPWFAHRRSLPLTTEMNYFGRMTAQLFLNRLGTLNWSAPHLLRRMFGEWKEWGLQWWLMLAAFCARPIRAFRQSQLLFILDVAGALTSLLVAGMFAPAQLDEHIGGSSHRFLMQIAPVAVLFAVTTFLDQGKGICSSADRTSAASEEIIRAER